AQNTDTCCRSNARRLDARPYSPVLGQGVCDFGQVCGLGDHGETVSLLGEVDLLFAGLTGHILVPVENDLSTEGRMPGHLDSDVSPFRVHNVKRVMIDESSFGFEILDDATGRALHIPNRGYRTTHQNQK